MNLAPILREIGRGREGARSMTQELAREVMAHILRAQVGELELGAFCAAMRIKGETAEEVEGFLRAVREVQVESTTLVDDQDQMPVVLPSYNGSRRLPLLTPLLALMLAQRGVPVVLHGMATEDARVHAFEVFAALDLKESSQSDAITRVHTRDLSPGLAALLDLRRRIGLRNSAHSLVKLLNPCAGRALVVGCYTHPEYAVSMREVFERCRADAVLLRGTEGEPVADPRRRPELLGFSRGRPVVLQGAQEGSLRELPELPAADAESTARWTQAVLQGQAPVPASLVQQVDALVNWRARLMDEPLTMEPTT